MPNFQVKEGNLVCNGWNTLSHRRSLPSFCAVRPHHFDLGVCVTRYAPKQNKIATKINKKVDKKYA
jgi:hypothetical protein